ncbi:hypothetical protein RA278_27985, partial [Pseudomonas syringae pv. tagetis]
MLVFFGCCLVGVVVGWLVGGWWFAASLWGWVCGLGFWLGRWLRRGRAYGAVLILALGMWRFLMM